MDDDDRRLRLEALWAAHASAVLAYARRRTSGAVADDVLSDVFLVALRCLDEMPEDARAWLLSCARRSLGNHQRAERRRARLTHRLAGTGTAAVGAVELSGGTLAAALATLNDRDREVLLLTAWEGLSSERAAVVLGCSSQAIRVRAHRARKRLASALRTLEENSTPLTMEACND